MSQQPLDTDHVATILDHIRRTVPYVSAIDVDTLKRIVVTARAFEVDPVDEGPSRQRFADHVVDRLVAEYPHAFADIPSDLSDVRDLLVMAVAFAYRASNLKQVVDARGASEPDETGRAIVELADLVRNVEERVDRDRTESRERFDAVIGRIDGLVDAFHHSITATNEHVAEFETAYDTWQSRVESILRSHVRRLNKLDGINVDDDAIDHSQPVDQPKQYAFVDGVSISVAELDALRTLETVVRQRVPTSQFASVQMALDKIDHIRTEALERSKAHQ